MKDIFDGAMVVLAMYTLNFFHPGRLLFSQPDDSEFYERKGARSTSDDLA